MQKLVHRLRTSFNPWFLIPFLAWVLIGAILLTTYSRDQLFSTVNLHHNGFFDVFMRITSALGEGWGVIPILLGMLLFRSCRNWWYLATATVCNGVPALLVQFLKGIFKAPRPFEYYKSDPSWIHFDSFWGDHLYHNSFPSGHATGIFSLCVFLSIILPKKWEKFGLVLFLIAVLVAYSRMYLAAHFYADIFAGSMLGTITTIFCFALMKHFGKRTFVIETDKHLHSDF